MEYQADRHRQRQCSGSYLVSTSRVMKKPCLVGTTFRRDLAVDGLPTSAVSSTTTNGGGIGCDSADRFSRNAIDVFFFGQRGG
ncbi:hypothetical protein Y032_0537g3125 [Ancylostoma ceylanicum]|uniref:Uncharacterized protein n=1 Tax=Ancylostoma ceylanicum TaxID=53326 RepID=A0A016WRR3_9BILA|nr:hypothetical protein Y032_0537g3125 [Ancylostoma ceylanicum]